ncbi:phytanoyl-CoA dioxygenase: peroxisomal-like protein [Dinothrombium tinctorium]|uniref:phytanoyl-CoA dioxygenase n=1 Tax=Dinothrombium tinctorium TaxID=1965070 RepID=A0A3S3PL57_9ACAR|nr:phytanoyl-CoA dioxygenase: peroxisomal-like protein [Dinothrombium tinctorium]RWS10749.1 phytanoyl-CoA dioxygenase: peroxisomal-like protein [Dinothrombium tinctorium]RWS11946.1 phytanoyl-CoA dioxygenase: peroxisomal-like protein [Dinothrombium tinctorium]
MCEQRGNTSVNPRDFWPKKYRYTREVDPGLTHPLTVKQRDFYEDNGYLVVRNCVPKAQIERYRQQYVKGVEEWQKIIESLAKQPQIVKYVEAFCGSNIMWMNASLIDGKQLQPQQQWHQQQEQFSSMQRAFNAADMYQDLFALPFRPADRIVGCWTALKPANKVNGCFFTISKTHKCSQFQTTFTDCDGLETKIIYEPFLRDNDQFGFNKANKEFEKRFIELNPGDTLFYHPLLLYTLASDIPSTTANGAEIAIIASHYASSDCEYVEMSGIKANRQYSTPTSLRQMITEYGKSTIADTVIVSL